MRKRFLCIICCSMLAFSGCGVGSSVVNNRSYNTQSESGSSYAEDVEDIDDMETDEDYYDEDSQIYDVQSKYLKAIQDYSGTELNDHLIIILKILNILKMKAVCRKILMN